MGPLGSVLATRPEAASATTTSAAAPGLSKPSPGVYAAACRRSSTGSEAATASEHVMQHNARKQQVSSKICHQAFLASGLLQG